LQTSPKVHLGNYLEQTTKNKLLNKKKKVSGPKLLKMKLQMVGSVQYLLVVFLLRVCLQLFNGSVILLKTAGQESETSIFTLMETLLLLNSLQFPTMRVILESFRAVQTMVSSDFQLPNNQTKLNIPPMRLLTTSPQDSDSSS